MMTEIDKQLRPASFIFLMLLSGWSMCLTTSCSWVVRDDYEKLYRVIVSGNTAKLERLLSDDIDVNSQRDNELSPLAMASAKGEIEMVRMLIEHGAEPNVKYVPNMVNQPLTHAAENGHLDIMKLLLGKGANPNLPNSHGDLALMYAHMAEQREAIDILVAHGADPDLTNSFGISPFLGACLMEDFEVADLYLENGADIEKRYSFEEDEADVTPLLYCTADQVQGAVRFLLERGADRSATFQNGETALDRARSMNNQELIDILRSDDVPSDDENR